MSSNQILAASLFSPARLCAAVTKTEGSFENFPRFENHNGKYPNNRQRG